MYSEQRDIGEGKTEVDRYPLLDYLTGSIRKNGIKHPIKNPGYRHEE